MLKHVLNNLLDVHRETDKFGEIIQKIDEKIILHQLPNENEPNRLQFYPDNISNKEV